MAIDTENKRRSAASTGPFRRVAPAPDGSLTSGGDWQQIVGRYRGIAAALTVAIVVGRATEKRTGLVGTAQDARSGIVGGATEKRTGLVGTAQDNRFDG